VKTPLFPLNEGFYFFTVFVEMCVLGLNMLWRVFVSTFWHLLLSTF